MPASADRRAYTVAPTFAVRVAGLPIQDLHCLRFERTTKSIKELLTVEAWLERQREPLCEALYEAIGIAEDQRVRRRLIALRRAVYQGKASKDKEFDDHTRSVLSPKLRRRIAIWHEQVKRRSAIEAKAETVLETETIEKRRELQKVADDNVFHQGLVLASRGFYSKLSKWLRTGPNPLPDRKLEIRLVKYLCRVATKTSPYSTFTSSGQGRWVEDAPSPTLHCAGWTRSGVVEFNVLLAQWIGRELSRWPEIRDHLILEVNSSLLEENGSIRFLGQKRGETMVNLTSTPTLSYILRAVRSKEGCTYGKIVQQLSSGARLEHRSEEAVEFLDYLIDLGLLELNLSVPDQSLDHLSQLLKEVSKYSGVRIESVKLLLKTLQSHVAAFTTAEPADDRFEQTRSICDTLDDISRKLGWTQRGIELPKKDAIYENTLTVGMDFRCSTRFWRSTLDDLHLLHRLTGLYDRFLPGRLTATAFFVDHYGVGASEDLGDFYQAFCKEVRQPGGWRPNYHTSGADLRKVFYEPYLQDWSGLDRLEQLGGLKRELRSYLIGRSSDDGQVSQLDRSVLEDFASRIPAFAGPSESVAFRCQIMLRDGTPHLVLNDIDVGFWRSQAQLWRLDQKAAGDDNFLVSQAPRADSEQVLHADISSVSGSNLNLRVPTTDYEIRYPGAISHRPSEEQIPLNDLRVEHDPEADRLRLVSRSMRREVSPLHLGIMADFFLPSAYRFLIRVFGQSPSGLEFTKRTLDLVSFGNAEQEVHRFPRLCLGNVVISRATWATLAGPLMREKGETPLTHMIKVTRWCHRHQVPKQCFFRILSPASYDSQGTILHKSRKPMYVDFSSFFSLRVLEQMIKEPDQLVMMEEMLPAYEDLMVHDARGSYVSECIFELTHHQDIYG